MEKLREAAFLSVGRAVGFSGLAIFTFMIGLSIRPVVALKAGGVALLILLFALLYKAYRLPFTDYRNTETWLILDKRDRPDERFAGMVIITALREAYLWFARWAAGLAAILWAAVFVLGLLGIGSDFSV